MHGRALGAIGALVLLLGTAPTVALTALQSDAGSRMDAGDAHHVALPVPYGSHDGTLDVSGDLGDWYAFEAKKGERIDLGCDVRPTGHTVGCRLHGPPGLDGDGSPVMFRRLPTGGTVPFVVPWSGQYFLAATVDSIQLGWAVAQAVPYRFTVDRDLDAHAHVTRGGAGSWTLEAAWSPGNVVTTAARIETPADPADPLAGMLLVEYRTVATESEPAAEEFIALAFEDGAVAPGSLTSAAATLDTDSAALSSAGVQGTYLALQLPATTESVRWTVYSTHPDQAVAITVSAGTALDLFVGHAEGILHETELSLVPEPILRNAGGLGRVVHTYEATLGSRSLGLFDTQGAPGHAVAPDGHVHEPLAGRYVFLLWPTPGTWRFQVELPGTSGTETLQTYLHAAEADPGSTYEPTVGPLPA